MTSSNRTLNRVILFVLGLVFVLLGAAAILAVAGIGVAGFGGFGSSASGGSRFSLEPSGLVLTAWMTAVGALIVLVLCLLWILTRGRGRTSRAIRVTSADGTVEIDRRYLEDTLDGALEGHPDITGVSLTAFRFRGQRACRLIVTVRRGGDVPRVAERVRAAVAALDAELGVQVPIVARLSAAPFANARRAA